MSYTDHSILMSYTDHSMQRCLKSNAPISCCVCVLFCTWLVNFLYFFAGHVHVFLFCVSTWLCLSFLYAMCSHFNFIPTLLVSWLLMNLPHLSSLVTLLICSLYNLLVFAVLPCPVLSCPAKPGCQLSCFSLCLNIGYICLHFAEQTEDLSMCFCFVVFRSSVAVMWGVFTLLRVRGIHTYI